MRVCACSMTMPAQAGKRLRPGRSHVDPGRRAAAEQIGVGVDAVVRDAVVDVHVQVDQPRHHQEAGRVDALAARQALSDHGDAPVVDRDVRDAVGARGRAEHVAAGDHEVVRHGIRPSSCRRSSARRKACAVNSTSVGAVRDREQAAAVEEMHALEQHRALQRTRERRAHAALERHRVVGALAEDEAERGGLAVGEAGRRARLEGGVERVAQLGGHGVGARQAAAVGQQVERRRAGHGRERVGVVRARVLDLAAAVAEGEDVHDVGAPGQRAAGHAAGDDLGERREVGRDADHRLRAARRPAEARHDLVEHDERAVRARGLGDGRDALGRERHGAPGGAGRLEDHAGHVAARELALERARGERVDHREVGVGRRARRARPGRPAATPRGSRRRASRGSGRPA